MEPSSAPPGSGTNHNSCNSTPDDSSPAHHTWQAGVCVAGGEGWEGKHAGNAVGLQGTGGGLAAGRGRARGGQVMADASRAEEPDAFRQGADGRGRALGHGCEWVGDGPDPLA
eukprot:1611509-Prymnesium_polylepis.1